MTTLAAKLDGGYGAAKYCKDANDPKSCRDLNTLEEVLLKSRDYDEQLDCLARLARHRQGRARAVPAAW
jgi:peptidyl-dipeptidase A